jgi:hypothetical protein
MKLVPIILIVLLSFVAAVVNVIIQLTVVTLGFGRPHKTSLASQRRTEGGVL